MAELNIVDMTLNRLLQQSKEIRREQGVTEVLAWSQQVIDGLKQLQEHYVVAGHEVEEVNNKDVANALGISEQSYYNRYKQLIESEHLKYKSIMGYAQKHDHIAYEGGNIRQLDATSQEAKRKKGFETDVPYYNFQPLRDYIMDIIRNKEHVSKKLEKINNAIKRAQVKAQFQLDLNELVNIQNIAEFIIKDDKKDVVIDGNYIRYNTAYEAEMAKKQYFEAGLQHTQRYIKLHDGKLVKNLSEVERKDIVFRAWQQYETIQAKAGEPHTKSEFAKIIGMERTKVSRLINKREKEEKEKEQ